MTHLTFATPKSLTTEVQGKERRDAVLLKRLGIDTLPVHETLYVALERLIIPGAALIERSARRLVKSIERVGILQAPAVMLVQGSDIHAPDATFEVIAGRRRVLAARLAGLQVIKCEVYEASTPQLASLITLIENEQRSAAWVKEVEAIRRLIDEKVGLTLDDLAAFGFDRASLGERLKIAQLPEPLVERVLVGQLTRQTARKLVRLTRTQQEQIASLAERGEEITVDTVKHALRAQIDAGLAPMQAQLAQAWGIAPPLSSASSPMSAHAASANMPPENDNAVPQTASALVQLVAALHHFEQSDDYRTVPQAVRSLTTALMQQVQVCLRTPPSSSSTPQELKGVNP
jgi:ParB/RepB/Spo0J family partition protein